MIEFKLPSLGADMDEGTLLQWLVQPGDSVSKGQVIAVVDTSKTVVDVECWQEGTVAELLVQPPEKIPVGTVLALLLEAGETLADAQAYKREKLTAVAQPEPRAAGEGVMAAIDGQSASQQALPARGGGHLSSPVARRRAQELGIDIATVTGSGPRGVITLEDVERTAQSLVPSSVSGRAAPQDRHAGMRQAIAMAMSRSKREIPHYYLAEPIPMAATMRWLAQANAGRTMTERLLPAVLLLKATALSLRRVPELNGWFRDSRFVPSERVNLGVAVSLRQGGLMAPALLDADRKDLETLMRELAALVKRTRAGSLKSSELSEATVTVTNLGEQSVESVFGVIYPPQVALIGFGQITERPWIVDGQLAIAPVVTASLSADHRISDGHRGALFLAELREQLQQPEELDKGDGKLS